MIIHLQHGNIALAHRYLISLYLSHSVLDGELNHQVVSWSYRLSWFRGRTAQNGVVSRRTVNNQEWDIFGNLLKAIIDCHGQSDRTKGIYSCSSESKERCVGWNQLFSLNPHLIERQVVKDISKAPIVYKDPVGAVVPHPYAYYERIVMWVVETPSIFLCESNYKVVDLCHL